MKKLAKKASPFLWPDAVPSASATGLNGLHEDQLNASQLATTSYEASIASYTLSSDCFARLRRDKKESAPVFQIVRGSAADLLNHTVSDSTPQLPPVGDIGVEEWDSPLKRAKKASSLPTTSMHTSLVDPRNLTYPGVMSTPGRDNPYTGARQEIDADELMFEGEDADIMSSSSPTVKGKTLYSTIDTLNEAKSLEGPSTGARTISDQIEKDIEKWSANSSSEESLATIRITKKKPPRSVSEYPASEDNNVNSCGVTLNEERPSPSNLSQPPKTKAQPPPQRTDSIKAIKWADVSDDLDWTNGSGGMAQLTEELHLPSTRLPTTDLSEYRQMREAQLERDYSAKQQDANDVFFTPSRSMNHDGVETTEFEQGLPSTIRRHGRDLFPSISLDILPSTPVVSVSESVLRSPHPRNVIGLTHEAVNRCDVEITRLRLNIAQLTKNEEGLKERMEELQGDLMIARHEYGVTLAEYESLRRQAQEGEMLWMEGTKSWLKTPGIWLNCPLPTKPTVQKV